MTQAYTNRFTEVHELAGHLCDLADPGVYTTLNYRSMANHQRATVIVMVGAMAQAGTIDLVLMQAQDAAGTGAKVIAGKSITQLTQAGGDGDDICVIEVRSEELDVNGGFGHVGAILTVGTAAAEVAVLALFGCSNYAPVTVANWTEVVD